LRGGTARAITLGMNTTRTKTLWSDGMILAAVRDRGGLTREARERALELAEQGLIDVGDLWVLTPAGAALADK
jgi:hypothetical protein